MFISRKVHVYMSHQKFSEYLLGKNPTILHKQVFGKTTSVNANIYDMYVLVSKTIHDSSQRSNHVIMIHSYI